MRRVQGTWKLLIGGLTVRILLAEEPVVRLGTPDPYRSMRAVILAPLVRNPDRDRLMGEYRPQVERCAGRSSLERYGCLVEYLKGHALGEA